MSEYDPARRHSRRPAVLFALGFFLAQSLVLTWPAIDPGLKTFYDRTIAHPGRPRFTIQHLGPDLSGTAAHRAARGVPASCPSPSLSFRKRKSLIQLAALSAALLIFLQLTLHHWFYLYIVWFYPLFLVALSCREGRRYPLRTACTSRAEAISD